MLEKVDVLAHRPDSDAGDRGDCRVRLCPQGVQEQVARIASPERLASDALEAPVLLAPTTAATAPAPSADFAACAGATELAPSDPQAAAAAEAPAPGSGDEPRPRQRRRPWKRLRLKPPRHRRRYHLVVPPPTSGRARIRGAPRHPLGGLDRRACARARRLLPGALFDRGGAGRPARAHHVRRHLCARAACGRRVDAAQGKHFRHRRAADRQHPGHPDRGRHRGRLRDRLRRLCALWLPCTRQRLHPARPRGARHARRSTAAWTRARRPRRGRRLRHAAAGLLRAAGLLGALHLSRYRHRGGLGAGADPALALAGGHDARLRAVLDAALPRLWPADGGPASVFHIVAGFVSLAALLVVCGFLFGPAIEDGQIEPISSGSLAAYLFAAMAIVLASFHADMALVVFAMLVAATLLVAWRAPAAKQEPSMPPRSSYLIVFAEWIKVCNPDMLVLPGGPLARHRTTPTGESVTLHLITAAIFAASDSASPDFWRRGRFGDRFDHSCGVAASAAQRRSYRSRC